MNINFQTTIIGRGVSGWWIFTDMMASRLSELTGLHAERDDAGRLQLSFKAENECIYTPKIVKKGFKLCIL